MGRILVFKNTHKLREMLILRSAGYSQQSLARRYDVYRNSIVNQCRKYNVRPGINIETLETPLLKDLIAPQTKIKFKEKYGYLIYEPINRGKLSYREYLNDYKHRHNLI